MVDFLFFHFYPTLALDTQCPNIQGGVRTPHTPQLLSHLSVVPGSVPAASLEVCSINQSLRCHTSPFDKGDNQI